MDLLLEAKKIKKFGIIGLVLFITIIVPFVMRIICGIKILTNDWKNKKLENERLIWGIFCFVILGCISAIIFGSIATKELSKTNSLKTENKISEENTNSEKSKENESTEKN